jgi:predicted extracellular nuclease
MNLAQALRIPPRIALVALALTGAALASGAGDARAAGDIVISQIFGGGGITGADLTNDFIELFNRGETTVSINGWSVQYAVAFGSTWTSTPVSGSIPPGGYYLVEEASGGLGTTPLPTPDASGSINLSTTAGKIALVDNTTLLSGTCPTGAQIMDFVGYGTTANCYEGFGPAPQPSVINSVQRYSQGCTDTDDNYADLYVAVALPRNSQSPLNGCHPVPVMPSTWGRMKSMYR